MRTKKTIREYRIAEIMTKRPARLALDGFSPKSVHRGGQLAELAVYVAKAHPGAVIMWEEAAHCLMPPPWTDDKIDAVKRVASTARRNCMKKRGCAFIVEPGIGFRASYDDMDIRNSALAPAVDTHQRAAERVRAIYGLIDQEKLKSLSHALPPHLKDESDALQALLDEHISNITKCLATPGTKALPAHRPDENRADHV